MATDLSVSTSPPAAAATVVKVRLMTGCDVQDGTWRSYYDGVTTHDSSTFDIDHLVPWRRRGTPARADGRLAPGRTMRTTWETADPSSR